jgi:glycerol-3-phosphate dehydrogenase
MAEEIVDLVAERLGRPYARAGTATLPLAGGEVPVETLLPEAAGATGDAEVAARLVAAHGARWRDVWARVKRDHRLGERLTPALPFIAAEAVHAVAREMACSLGDVLIRRVPAAFELSDQARSLAPRVAALLTPLLGWDDAAVRREIGRYEREVDEMFRWR